MSDGPQISQITQSDKKANKKKEKAAEREPRIDPCHPERPKFGFAPTPFVVIKSFPEKTP